MDSESLKAAMTFRISPGAGISITSLIFPVLPPLSATVTIAVISMGNSLNPLAKTDKPVPPPISTTFYLFHILSPLSICASLMHINIVIKNLIKIFA